MYVIASVKNKQYKLFKYCKIKIEKIDLPINNLFIINKILMFRSNSILILNNFFLKKIYIICRIISQGRYKKINIFKMKKRKHFKKFKTHKQYYTEIYVEKINFNFLNHNGS